jgi:hypothetical protein
MVTMFGLGINEIVWLLLVIEAPSVLALMDISRKAFPPQQKLVWALLVIFFPLIGAGAYWFWGRKHRIGQ